MKAVYIKEFGGPENLEIRDVPDLPKPSGTQVLVRVRASALNRADLLQRMGKYPPPPGYSPNIPGLEFAGEVAEIGEQVDQFKPGDRVFAITGGEAQAEYVLIDERLLAKIPDNLSFVEAAAVPEVFITASDAIFTLGDLKEYESLLVHAVGSGVGLAALQLAKADGAKVFGTSRTQDKLDAAAQFGLDVPILTEKPEFSEIVLRETDGHGVDVVLDLVGAAYFRENLASLAKKGRLILIGTQSGSRAEFDLGIALTKRLSIIGTVLRARPFEEKVQINQRFIEDVIPLLAAGKVRPNVDKVFPVAEIRAAHEYMQSNASFGKIVIEF
jgi:putative PIG3 family NAD(P)H quinone oxidoreductase